MNLFEKYLNRVEKDSRRETDRIAVRVYSEILGCYLWIIETDQDLHTLRSQGKTEPAYTINEIRQLKDLSKGSLKDLNQIKETFPMSIIENIIKRDLKE